MVQSIMCCKHSNAPKRQVYLHSTIQTQRQRCMETMWIWMQEMNWYGWIWIHVMCVTCVTWPVWADCGLSLCKPGRCCPAAHWARPASAALSLPAEHSTWYTPRENTALVSMNSVCSSGLSRKKDQNDGNFLNHSVMQRDVCSKTVCCSSERPLIVQNRSSETQNQILV